MTGDSVTLLTVLVRAYDHSNGTIRARLLLKYGLEFSNTVSCFGYLQCDERSQGSGVLPNCVKSSLKLFFYIHCMSHDKFGCKIGSQNFAIQN